MTCPLCERGLGREEHLVLVAMQQLGDGQTVEVSPIGLTAYINQNLKHLSIGELHRQLFAEIGRVYD